MKKSLPETPAGLSEEARDWWNRIVAAWQMDDAALLILTNAMQAIDRLRQAQALLQRDGIVVEDRWKQKKPHPAVAIERDCKATLLRCLKALNLEIEPLFDRPGRPAGK